MKIRPDPNTVHPISGYENEIYVKPTLKNPNICVGEFTYIADSDFESHVTHLYDWNGDRLIIGKFCQIAAGVEFVMNGANHQMNAVTTFPFYTLEGWDMSPPEKHDLPLKGDTVIGSDVWVGQNAGRRSKALGEVRKRKRPRPEAHRANSGHVPRHAADDNLLPKGEKAHRRTVRDTRSACRRA